MNLVNQNEATGPVAPPIPFSMQSFKRLPRFRRHSIIASNQVFKSLPLHVYSTLVCIWQHLIVGGSVDDLLIT